MFPLLYYNNKKLLKLTSNIKLSYYLLFEFLHESNGRTICILDIFIYFMFTGVLTCIFVCGEATCIAILLLALIDASYGLSFVNRIGHELLVIIFIIIKFTASKLSSGCRHSSHCLLVGEGINPIIFNGVRVKWLRSFLSLSWLF